MRKLLFLAVCLALFTTACRGGDESPGGRGDSDQDLILSALFGSSVQFLNGYYWSGGAQIEECTGTTTEALLYCGTTLPPLRDAVTAQFPENVQTTLVVADNRLQGTLFFVTPQVSNTIERYTFSVTGTVSPGEEFQGNIVNLTPAAQTDGPSNPTAVVSGFRGELQPNQMVGSYLLSLSSTSFNGFVNLRVNFNAEKKL